jgi:5-methylcytosine-specific restriction endonuclease McrA
MPQGLNPYVRRDRALLQARASQIAGAGQAGLRRALLTRDQGLCLVCHTSVADCEESVPLHHLNPQRSGGRLVFSLL